MQKVEKLDEIEGIELCMRTRAQKREEQWKYHRPVVTIYVVLQGSGLEDVIIVQRRGKRSGFWKRLRN